MGSGEGWMNPGRSVPIGYRRPVAWPVRTSRTFSWLTIVEAFRGSIIVCVVASIPPGPGGFM